MTEITKRFTSLNAGDEISVEQAIAIYESKIWETWTDEEIVKFQLFTPLLCMPFDKFHEAVEIVLNRPVWTHEFADSDSLRKEYLGERKAPTFEEIVSIIPEEKRIILQI